MTDSWEQHLAHSSESDDPESRRHHAVSSSFGDCCFVEDSVADRVVWASASRIPAVERDAATAVGAPLRAVFDGFAAFVDNPAALTATLDDMRASGSRTTGRRLHLSHARVLELDCEPIGPERRYHLWRLREIANPHTEDSTRLKASLVAASSEWRSTVDAIPAVVLRLHMDGSIARINRVAMTLSGLDYPALIGRHVSDISEAEPWRLIAQLAGDAAEHGCAHAPEAHSDDGDQTWDIRVSRADDALLVFARDVTQEMRLRDAVRVNETMSAMGALVAGVAHEVRNPLFAISATLDAFDARFGDRGEEFRHISMLRTEVDRLAGFMQDLLDYGKPSAQRVAPASFVDVVRAAVAQCAEAAAQAGVQVITALDQAAPKVHIDVDELTQVVRNLLENAIQHSPANSVVRCDTRVVQTPASRALVCAVSDNGPGFAPNDLARAFDPFFTRRRGGTGFGLAIVQRIMVAHGGTATVENHPDVSGSVATVRLPLPQRDP